MDGSRIVECDSCGLWFTSPRIDEQSWINCLMSDTERIVKFTANRLKYGCGLSGNVKGWRKLRTILHARIFKHVERCRGGIIPGSLHDVGCGVGFLLQDAKKRGIKNVTGNELNSSACKVMNERIGLDVHQGVFPPPGMEEESLDAVIMRDCIEHTYHPLRDFKNSYKYMNKNGVIYVRTFHVDCAAFDKLQGNWGLLFWFWNHVFHFSTETLTKMIETAGFEIVSSVDTSYNEPEIMVLARKQ